jgi:hypothetical protein
MKAFVLIIYCLIGNLSLLAQTNVYHPFPDSNATWASTYDDINPGYSYDRFYLDGDTIMEGRIYNKVYNFINWNQRNFVGGIRQDTTEKRVYAKLSSYLYPLYPATVPPFQDTSDCLLYDFNLQIGDSIKIPSTYWFYGYLYVNNIDSTEIEGNYRKYWVLNSNLHPWENSYWIEGIGSLNGLFWPHYDREFSICNLECMTQDIVQLYIMDGGVGNCPYIPNSILNKEVNVELEIFPNPVHDNITLNFPRLETNEVVFTIFDFTGKLIVQKGKISTEQSHIDVSFLKEGIYIIQIEIENQFYNYKFIKSSP